MTDQGREQELQIQEALAEKMSRSEQRYRNLLDRLREWVFECDRDLRLTYVNRAWTDKLNWNLEDYLAHSLTDLFSKPDREHLRGCIEDGATSLEMEVAMRLPDGTSAWFDLAMQRQGDSWGGSLFDITGSKLSEQKLRQQKLESLVARNTASSVLITDAAGRIEWVNRSFEKSTGYAFDEVRGRRPGTLLQGPDTDVAAVTEMRDALTRNEGFTVEILSYSKGGTPYWVEIETQPVFDDRGVLTNFIAVETDVTERRAAQSALVLSEQRMRYVVENISEVIMRIDAHARISYVNPAWQRLTGYRPETSLTCSLYDYIAPAHLASVRDWFDACHQGVLNTETLSVQWVTKTGSLRWTEIALSPIVELRVFVGAVCRMTDIEERHAALEAIKEARDSAEALADAKSRFLANVSHEIRTPLNAMIGMSELLNGTQLDNQQQGFARTIHESGRTLLSLISDVLDYSKFDASAVELERSVFSVTECFEGAIEIVDAQAQERQLVLMLDVEPDTPEYLVGDPSRIRQVALNLLTNAIKFTECGEVSLVVGAQQLGADATRLAVRVSDTGIGISSDRVDVLFDAFTQADASTTRRYGGTGLGLAICRQICQAMQGEVEVVSQEGQGSTFTATMLLEPGPYTIEPRKDQAQAVALYLGRHDHAQRAISHALHRMGVETVTAVDIGAEWRGPAPQYVVCTDSFLARDYVGFRSTAPEWPELVHLRPFGLPAAPAADMTGTKTLIGAIRPGALKRALHFVRPLANADQVPSVADSARWPPLRVLVAEDQRINQEVIGMMLDRLGHQVTLVENGREAVEAVGREAFDVILMDLQMPQMDGLQATAAIRALGEYIVQPAIIAITANALRGDRERCLAAGMDDYLAKPLTRDGLESALARLDSTQSGARDDVGGNSFLRELRLTSLAVLTNLTAALKAGDGSAREPLVQAINYVVGELKRLDPTVDVSPVQRNISPADLESLRRRLITNLQ